MAELPASPAVTALVGGAILAVGYLIKYRGWTFLVSESTALLSDETPPVYASLIGNVTLVAGGFVLALAALQVLGFATLLPGWLVALLFVAAIVVVAPRLRLETEYR